MSRHFTFPDVYRLYGPDVERIAEAMNMLPSDADRLINARMESDWRERLDAKNPNDLKAFFAKRQEENRALRAGA